MITISLCMIVKNEEDTLERCLSSVPGIFDEIIIVDTGSIDQTKEVARKFTDKIYDFEWIDDFSAARNYSYDQASMEYIMWLDADDVVSPEDRTKLKDLKETLDSGVDVVMMKYNTGFDAEGNVTFSYYRERLSKRSRNFKWCEPVHELLEKGGRIINADIAITHQKAHSPATDRNIRIYERIISEGKELSPRGLYYYARELENNRRYEDAIKYFGRFLDSGKGWVEDNICACYEMANCYSAINDRKSSLRAMLRSFEFATPRAEICCQIGYHYKNVSDYASALFWFELATRLKKPENNWGFIRNDCWGYTPCIELAVCYDKLGNIEEAIKYNNMAGEHKPNNPSVLYNKKYFEGVQKKA
ncbi:MAG: glycosyltransferase [Firmicutes bacterium]|nr:glycosyltransferase [Bacillota bacterium]